MRYKIYAKNLVLTPALRIYIEEKIIRPVELRMKKAAESDLPILEVGISRTTEHHRKGKVYHAEVNLRIGSKLLRAVADDQDPRTAIDLLKDEIEGELMHFKGKRQAVERRGARRVKKEMHLARSARIRRGSRNLKE
ncbi:MAG: hypothetical protein UX07_C0012G0012 [Parcubacteria group bacterium GW2011_GWA2_45_30]|nr:MAG: hypothetical protein UX07_C0012G0012 [Parcubacteria group bacterium GW2011_GWA2_45_30]